MPNLFGIDIAGELNKAMGSGLLPVVLTKSVKGTRTVGSLTAGTQPTSTTYTGRGFIDDYTDKQITGTTIVTGDRKVSILGASISVIPAANDRVTIEGLTYNIIKVKRDPAAAVYECQVRGPSNV